MARSHKPLSNIDHIVLQEDFDLSGFARYLAKHDLVTGGCTWFSDKPEYYWAWSVPFSNATEGLNLKPSEGLDLLTKWLGNESSQHDKCICSVHINNPAVGLNGVWECLEQCYGTPESLKKPSF